MTNSSQSPVRRPIRTFGRTGGRALSARQQELIDTLLPRLEIPEVPSGALDPAGLFENVTRTCFEIGFGGGEHFLAQAARSPETGFIGCEPFVDGMAKVLTGIDEQALKNIRLVMDDARPLMSSLKTETISQVYILFPDPWPKTRQQKRRLIQPDFLMSLHRICTSGARIRFATDVKSYADEALWRFLKHGGFDWQARSARDWQTAPEDHVTTRYERKQLGDCAPVWLDFVRS